MKLNAYILAADPACIEASVLSYYDAVDQIIVSYDENGLGLTGVPINVDQCLRRLRAIDKAGKCSYRPGHFARREFFDRPMENETYQRRVALEQAGEKADWVLQVDTDEVLADPEMFLAQLRAADSAGAGALAYPARNLYQSAGGGRYLEQCLRDGSVAAALPGPVAIKPGTPLRQARRCEDTKHWFVHYSFEHFQGAMPNMDHVDAVINPDQSIWHFSWVRSPTEMRTKLATWSHSADRDWSREYRRWLWSRRFPRLASFCSRRLPRRLWSGPPLRITDRLATADTE